MLVCVFKELVKLTNKNKWTIQIYSLLGWKDAAKGLLMAY
jgi:hypothetical protein